MPVIDHCFGIKTLMTKLQASKDLQCQSTQGKSTGFEMVK